VVLRKQRERYGTNESSDQNERPGRDVFAGYAVWFSACFCGNFMALLVKLDARNKVGNGVSGRRRSGLGGRGYTGQVEGE
jgi:hypothetical protein